VARGSASAGGGGFLKVVKNWGGKGWWKPVWKLPQHTPDKTADKNDDKTGEQFQAIF
jgi:hypothetical protein